MPKGKIFKICLFVMTFAFTLHLYKPALAGDCADKRGQSGIPTSSGNREYPPGWLSQCPPEIDFEFDDDSTQDTITSGGSIDVYITGGCAPFTYTVTSGTGATWNASGSTSCSSNNRNEQLNLADGT